MLEFVAAEGEAVWRAEGGRLRGDQRVGAGAAQPRQIGVVDNAVPRGVAPKDQGLVEEALHFEAIKGGVELEVPAFAVALIPRAE